jgi:hypothetical protein
LMICDETIKAMQLAQHNNKKNRHWRIFKIEENTKRTQKNTKEGMCGYTLCSFSLTVCDETIKET